MSFTHVDQKALLWYLNVDCRCHPQKSLRKRQSPLRVSTQGLRASLPRPQDLDPHRRQGVLSQAGTSISTQTQKLREALDSLKDIKSKSVASRVECENKIQEVPLPPSSFTSNHRPIRRSSVSTRRSTSRPTTKPSSRDASASKSNCIWLTARSEWISPARSMSMPSANWISMRGNLMPMRSSSGSW